MGRASVPGPPAALQRLPQGIVQKHHPATDTSLSAGQPLLDRRAALGTGVLGAFMRPLPAFAGEPRITAKCSFAVRIGQQKVNRLKKIVIGVYGDEAPNLSRTFLQAVTGCYPGAAGRQAFYQLSDVKNIEKNKGITWANFEQGNQLVVAVSTFDSRWVGTDFYKADLAGEDTLNDDANSLRHDVAGRVSMRRGGGTFDFTIAPTATAPQKEGEDVVIGQVLEGMDLVADINKIRMYGGKPLTKVRIMKSELIEGELPA